MGIYLWPKSSIRLLPGFPHSESVPAAQVLTSPTRSSTSRSWSRYEIGQWISSEGWFFQQTVFLTCRKYEIIEISVIDRSSLAICLISPVTRTLLIFDGTLPAIQ